MMREEMIKLPKIELHCHLDGSLSQEFIERRLGRHVRKEELSVSDDCRSLAEYLEKFDLPGQCLRDERGLEEAGFDVLKSMSRENVCYAEIRFAPLFSETASMSCAEASYPMTEFMNLFQNARRIGMPFTIHAGECGSAENIKNAVDAGAARIGHGIAMRGHADLIRELAQKKIGIEMCPISNLQTKAVPGPEVYPLREFIDGKLLVTVNTDNRTVSNTTMTKELEFIQKTYNIMNEGILLMMKNAAGGVNLNYKPGDFMLITDHITTAIPSPLIGENLKELGTRFPDMSEVYSLRMQGIIKAEAEKLEIPLRERVYVQFTGPAYETPAEIRMCRSWGGDAVGMSTACEAVAAKHMGMETCGISCITNMAAGISKEPLNHKEVQETADRVAVQFKELITAVVENI